jgi:hypothetical protein
MKNEWTKIADNKVRHVWKKDCKVECFSLPIIIKISPTEYANSGIPICQDCGNDFIYVRTEIKK